MDLADRGIKVAIINMVKMKSVQGLKGKYVLINGQIGNINRNRLLTRFATIYRALKLLCILPKNVLSET